MNPCAKFTSSSCWKLISHLDEFIRKGCLTMRDLFNPIRNQATRETAPFHIWLHSVIMDAGVSVEQAEATVTRDRLVRWYQAGEPVWMAADGTRDMVQCAAVAAAANRDGLTVLRAAYRAGRSG